MAIIGSPSKIEERSIWSAASLGPVGIFHLRHAVSFSTMFPRIISAAEASKTSASVDPAPF